MNPYQALADLEHRVAAISRAETPTEIFRATLEGARSGAPRAAMFLLRERRWKGWGATGHPGAASHALRAFAAPEDGGFLARAAADLEASWLAARAGDDLPRFGQPRADETLAFPVRVGGHAVAIVMIERGAGESPWYPEAVAIAVQAARMRLELDLAWRRLRAAAPAQDAAADAVQSAPAPEPTPASALEATLEPAAPPEPEAPPDPRDEDARRFARLVATDIRLYNEDAVVQGRRNGDLASRLGDQLQRGVESFERRFPGFGPAGRRILREAYVQVLAGGDTSLIPHE